MRLPQSTTRAAFSLMEMMLALTLGMLLLLALYLALTTHFSHAQAGRDVVAEATLSRNVLARVADDINGQLGPVDKRGSPDYAALAAAAAAAATATPPAAGAAAAPTTSQDPVNFNRGVRGESNWVIISSYRVQKPRDLAAGADAPAEGLSDLRQTMYWIAGGAGQSQGLARAEVKQATGADADLADPTGLPEQDKYIIAPEVKSIEFSYFDGSSSTWVASWDGAAPADEAGNPIGPPAAIKVIITLRRTQQGTPVNELSSVDGSTYQQIVVIPASNSWTPQTSQ